MIFCNFSRWRPPPSWFLKIRYFNGLSPVGGPICVTIPNFIKIGQTIAQIWRFNFFFKRWPSAILDLSGAYRDHPRRLLGGLYRCAKFGWNRCRTFDNMKVLIFCVFGLKTRKRLFTPPKLGFWGDFTLSREQY